MTSSVTALGRRIANLEAEVKRIRQPQLANSAIEDGAIEEYDEDDSLVQIIGRQYDGTHGAQAINGPTPPTPTAPSLYPEPGGLVFHWGGLFEDSLVAPLNFTRVDFHASQNLGDYSTDPLGEDTLIASVTTTRGGRIFIPLSTDVYYSWAVAWNASGLYGDPSAVSSATPLGYDVVLPPPAVPTASPKLQAVGLSESLFIRAEEVPADQLIQFFISNSSTFEVDESNAVSPPTRSPVMVVKELPDGTALDPDTVYYLRSRATNESGTAAPSAPVAVRLDPEAVERATLSTVQAGFALLGALNVGLIEITPDGGVIIPQPDGGTITLPADGTDALITAGAILKSLTLEGEGVFLGESTLSGVICLANGVANPRIRPTAGVTYPSLGLELDDRPELYTGLADGGDRWFATRPYSGGKNGFLRHLDKESGLQIATVGITSPAGGISGSPNWAPDGGIVFVGGELYGLGLIHPPENVQTYWQIRKIDVNTGVATFVVTVDPEDSFDKRPTIGKNELGQLLVCGHYKTLSAKRHYLHTYTTAGARLSTQNIDLPDDTAFNLTYVERGSFDLGATCYVVGNYYGRTFVLDSGRAHLDAFGFDPAGGNRSVGKVWSDGRFYSLNESAALHTFSKTRAGEVRSLAYTWYDGNPQGNTHETQLSPTTVATVPARAFLRVECAPPPQANGDPDEDDNLADQIRVYASSSGDSPTLQGAVLSPTRSLVMDSLEIGGPTPPASNQFELVGATPGRICSLGADIEGELVKLLGDGSWRLANLHAGIDGVTKTKGLPIYHCVGAGYHNGTVAAGVATVTHNLNLPAEHFVTATPRTNNNARILTVVTQSANYFEIRIDDSSNAVIPNGDPARFNWQIHLDPLA